MELGRTELLWLRSLAAEMAAVSRGSRGGRVFFDQEWIDEVVVAIRAITDSDKKKKSGVGT